MTMVVGNGETCTNCGRETAFHSQVWVRVNFYREHVTDGVIPDHDCYFIGFCSLKCMLEFDWEKLKTREDWWRAHRQGLKRSTQPTQYNGGI